MSMTKLMYLMQWDDPLLSCSFTTQNRLLLKNLMWWSKMDNIFRIYRVELTKITLSGPSIFRKSQICWPVYNILVKRIYCNTISALRNSYLSDSNENMYHFLHKNRLYRWAPLTVALEEPLKNFSSVRYFSFPVFQPSVGYKY